MPEPAIPQRLPSRSTFTVDVGVALRARLNAAAAASGRSPSQLIRELLTRSLAPHDVPGQSWIPAAPSAAEPSPTVPELTPAVRSASVGRRIELDPELASQLDAYKARGGFRSRPAAIRFALETANQYRKPVAGHVAREPDLKTSTAASSFDPLDPTWLKDATRALIRNNASLQPIGNDLNQIARRLNAMPGLLNGKDAKTIADTQKQLRAHVEHAARLVYSLRTYITPFAGE